MARKKNGWRKVAECVYQRGDSFEVRVRMGDGQRETRTAHSKEDAIELRNVLQSKRRRGKQDRPEVTIREWHDEWIATAVDRRGRPWEGSTLAYYRSMASRFVQEFGDRPLSSFTRQEAQEYSLEHPGRARSVSAMFGAAFDRDRIDSNPFERVYGYRQRKARALLDLSREEVEGPGGLLDVAEKVHDSYGPAYAAMVATAARTGMRPGELFALRWGDIAWKEGVIHVRRTKQDRTGEIVEYTKNKDVRVVVAPPSVFQRLRVDVPEVEGSDLVFHTRTGSPFTLRSNHYYWNPVRVAWWAKLPKVRQSVIKPDIDFYELRHFCAREMLKSRDLGGMGAPAYMVAEQLGHKDGGTLVQELYGRQQASDAVLFLQKAYREMSG